ncbi:MAG TPA: hypothetical protein VE974_08075 [Thermoanaerobaculia bacterium]|nr:hypothetical protein [Thermoanaerobaculia bacterium]
MKLRERRIGLLLLVTAALLSLTAQSPRPVNPLVVRTPQPGTAPADCDQGLAPVPPPRVAVEEIPRPAIEPVEAPAPPSGSLRGALHATQTALAENDRTAFDESLRSTRSLLATYPGGAEKRTGEELVRIYEGAARLWDAQYQSPFFDQASPEYQIVSAYPGYAEAVRRSTLTDPSGQRFYPAAESRDFLGRVAADRLRGIGIQAPTRVAERTPASTSRPRSTTTLAPTVTTNTPSATTSRTTPRRTTTATTGTVRPPRPRRSAPAIASRPRTSSTPEPGTSAPVTPAPGLSPNPSAPPTTAAAPEPAAPVAEAPEPATATTSPAAGESPAAPTTDTTVTTDTAPSPVPTTTTGASRARSVVLPTILILIGLVVLIVLFRASK